MSEGIDDILSGKEPAETPAETVEAPAETVAEAPPAGEDKASDGPARGPDGKFVPKGEKEDAPPASEDKIPVSAIQDERRKRQELERRVAEYEQRLQQLSNPPQPAPDMFENPEGWQSHFGNEIRQTAAQEAAFNATLNTSEMLARDKYDDFEEMKASFLELAQQNPVLAQQALSDPHPWRKAYQIAKTHTTMQQVGATDIDSLRAQIRAEIEAEVKAKAPPVDIPQTLATAQGGTTAVVPTAPPTLKDILGR